MSNSTESMFTSDEINTMIERLRYEKKQSSKFWVEIKALRARAFPNELRENKEI